jgi:hypothetical protein
MIAAQLQDLKTMRAAAGAPEPAATRLQNGAYLVQIPAVDIGAGWTTRQVTVLFVAPPGYPAAQPDCFWVEPAGLRLAGGETPKNTNDGNPIPADNTPQRRTTWFSWHLQSWNPNTDSLVTYFKVIMKRLKPAR